MRASELRELKPVELDKRLSDLKEELFNLRFQQAVHQLENPQRIKVVRRNIARVKPLFMKMN